MTDPCADNSVLAPISGHERRRRTPVGLAGLGRMGQVHLRNLAGPERSSRSEHRHCALAELAAVYDADPERAAAVGAEYGVPAAATFAELLERCEVVAIATSTASHASLVQEAAAAGKPVFCEKPLATTEQAWATSRSSAPRCAT